MTQTEQEYPAVRFWPVLTVGFTALVVLIGLCGWFAFIRSRHTYEAISGLYRSQYRALECLSQVRLNINTSAILLRDFLLDRQVSAGDAQQAMAELRRSTEFQFDVLSHLQLQAVAGQADQLRNLSNAYWNSLNPALTKVVQDRAQEGFSVLRQQIAPHRQAALDVLAQIQALDFATVESRRREIDGEDTSLATYLIRIVGITVLIVLGVATLTVQSLHRLAQDAFRQHKQVQEAEAQLRKLSQQLVTAQEEERKTLSRDLHDQVGQVLTALRLSLGNLEQALSKDSESTDEELERSKRLAGQALRSTRDLAMGLRPMMLDDLGLQAALEWLARQHSRVTGVPVVVEIRSTVERLPEEYKTCIYRLTQEALNNSAKHASATSACVRIRMEGECLRLEISDDGSGFEPAVDTGKGLGLLSMQERTAQLGGTFAVESSLGQGVRIMVDLPFPEGVK